ncbi:hypothetical protein TGRH88_052820 [Toxoplasma gondii]|uniref:Uncharacterized protein n=1 Tax=Toxoplasma gondii TaxID=5811 RepID=A0A7J6JYB8_TOXGO|nr:hypothetical protein TGRH88_052820 [Toxoplasma gondii]
MGQPPPPGLCRLFGPVNFSHNFPLDDRTSASSLPIFQGEMVLPEVITLAKSLEGNAQDPATAFSLQRLPSKFCMAILCLASTYGGGG